MFIEVKAQQDAMYSQYMFNTLALNPAYAGSRDVLSVTGLFRRQWVNIEGAPMSSTLSADMPLQHKKIGVGLQVFDDRIGINKSTGFFTSYSYRLNIRRGTLAMGLQGGLTQYSANYTSVELSSMPTNAYDHAFSSNVSKVLPNVGTGLYYNCDKWYAGVSVPHLINNKLVSKSSLLNGASASQFRHFFVMGGYVFTVNPDIRVKPSILFKAVSGAPMQFDFNTNVWFYDKFSIGLSYRTRDAVCLLFEMQTNEQLRIGYAFDYSVSNLRKYNAGSHEIMLRYELGFTRKKIVSPRFF